MGLTPHLLRNLDDAADLTKLEIKLRLSGVKEAMITTITTTDRNS